MKNTGTIAIILCFLIIGFILYQHFVVPQKKIGVVQLQDLVYEYQGMKEATKKYTSKMEKWNAQADSLENALKGLLNEIKTDSINNDKDKLKKDQQIFLMKRQTYYEYRQKTEKAAEDEDKEMTAGVMNQVNEHIKAYAIKEGYDVIITNNAEMQTVGYVNEATDITKKLLEFANSRYKGEK